MSECAAVKHTSCVRKPVKLDIQVRQEQVAATEVTENRKEVCTIVGTSGVPVKLSLSILKNCLV
jgi:hypothetical protein